MLRPSLGIWYLSQLNTKSVANTKRLPGAAADPFGNYKTSKLVGKGWTATYKHAAVLAYHLVHQSPPQKQQQPSEAAKILASFSGLRSRDVQCVCLMLMDSSPPGEQSATA